MGAPIVDIHGSVGPAGISRPKHKRTFTGFGAGEIKNVEGTDFPALEQYSPKRKLGDEDVYTVRIRNMNSESFTVGSPSTCKYTPTGLASKITYTAHN